ncbi:MAG TPA: hypothetical protein VJG66_01040 [Patescibacteria group bacterium]|nr:hypothetical protein [Patescibacteria group bacterium]
MAKGERHLTKEPGPRAGIKLVGGYVKQLTGELGAYLKANPETDAHDPGLQEVSRRLQTAMVRHAVMTGQTELAEHIRKTPVHSH